VTQFRQMDERHTPVVLSNYSVTMVIYFTDVRCIRFAIIFTSEHASESERTIRQSFVGSCYHQEKRLRSRRFHFACGIPKNGGRVIDPIVIIRRHRVSRRSCQLFQVTRTITEIVKSLNSLPSSSPRIKKYS